MSSTKASPSERPRQRGKDYASTVMPAATSCCDVLVTCYLPEALRIAAFLNQPEQAEVKAAFLAAYPVMESSESGSAPERAMTAFAARTTAGGL
jgi:hypothetical protein